MTQDPHSAATIAVIGAGPAGLIAAERLAEAGHSVTVHDRLASPARRFLMAGRGGLNLTHAEDLETFLTRYGAARAVLEPAIRAFPPEALRAWADGLGAQTFVGSSHRVFPKAMKASPLLRAWLSRLGGLGVTLLARHRWTGWTDDGALVFETPQGAVTRTADATLLALGGLSWPKLGADPAWPGLIERAGVAVTPIRPANCGFLTSWSPVLVERFAGTPLKTVGLSFGSHAARGDVMITATGIEGVPVYALSAVLREAIEAQGAAELLIDLRPDTPLERLQERLARPRGHQSVSNFLRKAAGLSPLAIAVLRDACAQKDGSLPSDAAELAHLIKACPLRLTATAGLERAISSAGGITLAGLDGNMMLAERPGIFCAGEMLDWEAPTGGYLLQASYATGVAAAAGIDRFLQKKSLMTQ
ncbi:TIGR03862 family flavoprotein [Breoghania sp.]|uniref:NAD(P)/FAD-dependent oxidoreductase n=1 Tax=Breoghania sp. TaxID=2065378 RepID=UPI002AA8AAF9|nr:TIGR03862 family flavoprotein [Breoghania sp.]